MSEIEKLRAENAQLRGALEPLALVRTNGVLTGIRKDGAVFVDGQIPLTDIKTARNALAASSGAALAAVREVQWWLKAVTESTDKYTRIGAADHLAALSCLFGEPA